MFLAIFKAILLALGSLYLMSGSSKKDWFYRVTDYTEGTLLLILLVVVLYLWR